MILVEEQEGAEVEDCDSPREEDREFQLSLHLLLDSHQEGPLIYGVCRKKGNSANTLRSNAQFYFTSIDERPGFFS